MPSSRPPAPAEARGWRARLARAGRRLVHRVLLVAGGVALLRLNGLVGGLLGDFAAPLTPETITIGFARGLAVAAGLWLIYRGLR